MKLFDRKDYKNIVREIGHSGVAVLIILLFGIKGHAGPISGYIVLLLALLKEWRQGKVNGLKARGDVTVDIHWSDGTLQEVTLTADNTGTYDLRYQGKTIEVELQAGEPISVEPQLFN
jgi:hypothetical protein